MAILPYHLVTACNEAMVAYSAFEEKKDITSNQVMQIAQAQSVVYDWVDHFKDANGKYDQLKKLKFIFYPFNIPCAHYLLMVAVNPGSKRKQNDTDNDNKDMVRFFCLDS